MDLCSAPEGYVDNAADCDDGDAAVFPGAAGEVCDDGVDTDCNGVGGEDGFEDPECYGLEAGCSVEGGRSASLWLLGGLLMVRRRRGR